MEEDKDGKHRNHARVRRCIDSTRCVVIALLVGLVVAVIGLAIAAMYLHVEKLEISVANGYVYVPDLSPVSISSPRPPPKELVLVLLLKFSNPNDRWFAFDNINISIYFHDDDSNDKKVIPLSTNSSLQLVPSDGELDLSLVLDLHGDKSTVATLAGMVNGMKKPTVCLNGTFETLFTGINLLHAPPRPAVYECPNVTMGTLPLLQAKGEPDVSCQDITPRKWK